MACGVCSDCIIHAHTGISKSQLEVTRNRLTNMFMRVKTLTKPFQFTQRDFLLVLSMKLCLASIILIHHQNIIIMNKPDTKIEFQDIWNQRA